MKDEKFSVEIEKNADAFSDLPGLDSIFDISWIDKADRELSKMQIDNLVRKARNIYKALSEKVFGQNNAISNFIGGYFRAGMQGITGDDRMRPAAFLFAGPPGVGKTLLAEEIANELKLPYLKLDMSEFYGENESVCEIIGSDRTYKQAKPGMVTDFVKRNKKSVILFDEIEKAGPTVINLFLQLLDHGRLRDRYRDEEVSFSDTIIIMTTNAGKKLYDNGSGDLSTLPKKVIIKALQTDINPRTGNPYFPEAVCSRFAFGNVVMFNHVEAHTLRQIAKNQILKQAEKIEECVGIGFDIEEDVYTALLFSEGGAADARTINGKARSFFNGEMYELFRLVAAKNKEAGIEGLSKIKIGVDLNDAKPEVKKLFEGAGKPTALVFADKDTIALCREKMAGIKVEGASSLKSAISKLKKADVDIVAIDLMCGVKKFNALNIEDVVSPAREFFKYIRVYGSEVPVYLLEKEGVAFNEEERISFAEQGVRDIIDPRGEICGQVERIISGAHQQASMTELAKSNKLISFDTAQFISPMGDEAKIKLFDFNTTTAVEAEDTENVLSAVSKPNVRFEDVVGANSAKEELLQFVKYLKNPKKYMDTGLSTPKGVLLYGPPGTGKTMLAKAMAAEADVAFIAAEGNQFLKRYVGDGPRAVHEIFSVARKYAPAILFVDEIDAIAKERGGDADGGVDATLTAFLTEMDGFNKDPKRPVFVLAATNYDIRPGDKKSLDGAIVRRFDSRVYIGLPDKEARTKYLNMRVKENSALCISGGKIRNIATRAVGMSLADLASIIDSALRTAVREGCTKVDDGILEEAFEAFNNGEAKKWDISQLQRVARHEAGHALLCWHGGEIPSYLTIVARGNHGGYMQRGDNEGKAIYTKNELLASIRTSLGGRAAELVYYGKEDGVSTGAGADLAAATRTAEQIVCAFGMDEDFGLAVMTDKPTDEARVAINRILSEQMAETVRIVTENKDKTDALVEALMNKNHLSGDEIEAILKK